MAEPKTQRNDASVAAYLAAVDDPARRADAQAVCDLMQEVTGQPPIMWGKSIVGFGTYHYVYASGREGDWMATGFSVRKRDLTLYIMTGFDGHEALMARLGKHKTGKSCLYLKRLSDVDLVALSDLVAAGYSAIQAKYARS